MKVRISVYGHSRQFFLDRTPVELEFDEPLSVAQILEKLSINPQLIMSVFSGGQRRGQDYVPRDGEELVLVSPPAGG
ncbi:MAG TPA: MoaD/ThiS family protein [Firmicutes bacterium]|nr:MoaD/ThiS family protein [Bacillota bacterium]